MSFPYVKEAYAAKKYAFVSDYVRFWALYHEGGIYLDTDIFMVKPLDDLLDNKFFIGWETASMNALGCGVIGAEKGHGFIMEILQYFAGIHFRMEDVDNLIIPRIVTAKYLSSVQKDNATLYPFDYFYPFPYEARERPKSFSDYSTMNTYCIHLWNLSWVSPMRKILSRSVRFVKRFTP